MYFILSYREICVSILSYPDPSVFNLPPAVSEIRFLMVSGATSMLCSQITLIYCMTSSGSFICGAVFVILSGSSRLSLVFSYMEGQGIGSTCLLTFITYYTRFKLLSSSLMDALLSFFCLCWFLLEDILRLEDAALLLLSETYLSISLYFYYLNCFLLDCRSSKIYYRFSQSLVRIDEIPRLQSFQGWVNFQLVAEPSIQRCINSYYAVSLNLGRESRQVQRKHSHYSDRFLGKGG